MVRSEVVDFGSGDYFLLVRIMVYLTMFFKCRNSVRFLRKFR